MENQHRKIKGYRELSQYEIDAMNRIKAKGEELRELIEHLVSSRVNADPRWVQIGRTDLQTGIMALVRSVAKPDTF